MDPNGVKAVRKSQGRLSFLSLPGEVRNTIYELLLPTPGSTLPLGKDHQYHYVIRSNPHNHTALFLTCHQIRHEASSLFYPSHIFSISRPTQLTLYIRDLTPKTRTQLSHLSISVILNLSSLSRRRRRLSVLATEGSPPKGRNSSSTITTILTQNRELKHLAKFPSLKLLTISLNIEACALQRYLAPSHVVGLEELVPSTAELRIEVGRCAHCLHWHDSTSNLMAAADVEKNQQWWTWNSAPTLPPPPPPSPPIQPREQSRSSSSSSSSSSREWVLTRRIGGIPVTSQAFPTTINQSPNPGPTAPGPGSPEHASPSSPHHLEELLSKCYTCRKSLLPLTTESAVTPAQSSSSSSPLLPTQPPFLQALGQTCEVCGLVSFCSNLCFAACVEHQHLCVPRPFG